jgi:hypothetical protein
MFDHASPDMMEFGEQNWFGDVSYSYIEGIPKSLGMSSDMTSWVKQEMVRIKSAYPTPALGSFDLAKLFYKIIFNYKSYAAIDLHGTSVAQKFDLNQELPISDRYDVVTNIGTGEHVFNQYMFFKNMHDVTKENGLMINVMPNQGCYDHGFFNYHPTFIFDLAHANQYNLLALYYSDPSQKPPALTRITSREDYIRLAIDNKLSRYSGLHALLRKPATHAKFQIPRQGYYDNQLSPELKEAWSKMER